MVGHNPEDASRTYSGDPIHIVISSPRPDLEESSGCPWRNRRYQQPVSFLTNIANEELQVKNWQSILFWIFYFYNNFNIFGQAVCLTSKVSFFKIIF
jgi:hypothetical protein